MARLKRSAPGNALYRRPFANEKVVADHYSWPDGRVVFKHAAAAAGQDLCLQPIWQAAGGIQWPRAADRFARAEFAAANSRETGSEPRAVERRERPHDFRDRMAR